MPSKKSKFEKLKLFNGILHFILINIMLTLLVFMLIHVMLASKHAFETIATQFPREEVNIFLWSFETKQTYEQAITTFIMNGIQLIKSIIISIITAISISSLSAICYYKFEF